MSRTEHIYILPYQLTIIFIRCEHVGLYTFLSSLNRHSTNDIISLKTIYLEDRDVVGFEYVLMIGTESLISSGVSSRWAL